MRSYRVLSLCDGMSCGQIALRELGVPVSTYYASEINPFAIAQTMLNFPQTVQVGDVRELDVDRLCAEGEIDLLIGGSPCQDFSFAGKRAGMVNTEKEEIVSLEHYLRLKAEGFAFQGQSFLFWEYMRVLTALRKRNPKVRFLLENVEMKQRWERVLSEAIGLAGVHIDSALVSAQWRKRIYWSNIRTRQVGLFGSVETGIPVPDDRGVWLRDVLEPEVDPHYWVNDRLAKRITALVGALPAGERVLFQRGRGFNKGGIHTEKAPTLSAHAWEQNHFIVGGGVVRRVTPTEAARLQTVPTWYQWGCSTTQQYRLLGNGWTVEVIKHLLSFLDGYELSCQNEL